MTTPSIILATAKKNMRAHQVAVRRRAFADGGAAAAQALCQRLSFAPGTMVAAYWPMGDEMDPRPLMAGLEAAGCPLCLPVVVGRDQPLEFRAYACGAALEPGLHGTWHPPAAAVPVIPEVILLPLLAFDRQCFRLGYGGGYYDRTLENLRKRVQLRTIGIGFAVQEVAAVPRDGYDQRLDCIATERELITAELA